MKVEQIDRIKSHFESEAEEYDGIIRRLIPYYHQMMEALVSALPFEKHVGFDAIDLGCGTGTVSKTVQDAYPNARLTCLDIAENMLQMARQKLKDKPQTVFIQGDFYGFNFDKQYDAVVSSLALHHLVTLEDKLAFYKKIYAALKDGGIFVNADVVLASTDKLQDVYMRHWRDYMSREVSLGEIENKWIRNYEAEDRPASLTDHFDMLAQAGFKTVDVVWKYYNFAVYMAVK